MDGTWYKTSDPEITKKKCDGCSTYWTTDPGELSDKWTKVDFGSSYYLTVDDAKMGTIYINNDGRADRGEYFLEQQKIGERLDKVQICVPYYQCALARTPAKRNAQMQAGKDFAGGFRIGATNELKGFADIPTYNIISFTHNTSLNAIFGVPTFFDYEEPTARQQVGAFSGRVTTLFSEA